MRFCKDCGTALNLFGTSERELCSSCVQHKKKAEPRSSPAPLPTAAPNEEQYELLADAVLSYENNKIVLRSKEGWELWSGLPGTETEMRTILERAGRIYAIRLRRQKN